VCRGAVQAVEGLSPGGQGQAGVRELSRQPPGRRQEQVSACRSSKPLLKPTMARSGTSKMNPTVGASSCACQPLLSRRTEHRVLIRPGLQPLRAEGISVTTLLHNRQLSQHHPGFPDSTTSADYRQAVWPSRPVNGNQCDVGVRQARAVRRCRELT
jgi:hypothetical protein